MTLRTKHVLLIGAILALIAGSIIFGQWRANRAQSANQTEPASLTASQSEQPTIKKEGQPTQVEQPQSQPQEPVVADETNIAAQTVCGQVGGLVLTHYFTASSGEQHWRTALNEMLSEVGRLEQDTVDQRLIRPQEMIGYPAAKEPEDPEALQIHCEGTSNLTGWMISLSRTDLNQPWLVDSIRAMETGQGYFPPKTLEEQDDNVGQA